LSQANEQQRRVFHTSPFQQSQHKKAKRGSLANPGSLIVAALGLLFVGYIFNANGLQTGIDAYFGGLNNAVQSHSPEVSGIFVRTLKLLGAGLIAMILIALLRALGPSGRSLAQTEAREVTGIETFVSAAGEQGVSKKVARTAYKQLLPYVRKARKLGLKDTLCKDLRIKPEQVSFLYGALLRHADRRRTQSDDGTQLHTVLQLLQAVEASEDKSAPQPVVMTIKTAIATSASAQPPVAMAAEARPKKLGAVLVRPARLEKRELSMIRSRSANGA
jgi:hypothetical protein